MKTRLGIGEDADTGGPGTSQVADEDVKSYNLLENTCRVSYKVKYTLTI